MLFVIYHFLCNKKRARKTSQVKKAAISLTHSTARSEPGGIRWRTGGEVKGKLANGVGSQYSHATSERGLSSIIRADAYTSAASSRLNWRPHRFKWTRPFRGKTKSGFCACAITFRTSYTAVSVIFIINSKVTNTTDCSNNPSYTAKYQSPVEVW